MKRKRIRHIVPYCLLLAVILTSCEKPPDSTMKDGTLISEPTNEKLQTAANSKGVEKELSSPQETLQSFPDHYTKEFSSGTNGLYVDADIVIPEQGIKVYQANVSLSPWTKNQVETFSGKLEEMKLLSGNDLPEAFDQTSQVPLVGITYSNPELLMEDKSGTLQDEQINGYSEQQEKFCLALEACGLSVKLEPFTGIEGNWDGRSFSVAPLFEKLPLATGFPTTGTGRIINEFIGGSVTFSEEGIVDFFVNGKFNFTNREECKSLASMEIIENTIQTALDSKELIFSKDLKATSFSFEYLIVNESETLQMIPVWNVKFDVDAYYQSLEENRDQAISMMNLCINAVDGSVAYAI